MYAYVRNQLQTWVRELALGDDRDLADNPRAWAHWLARRVQRMRMHPAVDELINEIDYCHKLIRRVVDRHDDRVSVGRCEVCDHALMADAGADMVTCKRCEAVGVASTVVEVAPRRRKLLSDAEDRLLPRDAILRAVPLMWRVEVNRETFRSWVKRGRLVKVEDTPAVHRFTGSAMCWTSRNPTRYRPEGKCLPRLYIDYLVPLKYGHGQGNEEAGHAQVFRG